MKALPAGFQSVKQAHKDVVTLYTIPKCNVRGRRLAPGSEEFVSTAEWVIKTWGVYPINLCEPFENAMAGLCMYVEAADLYGKSPKWYAFTFPFSSLDVCERCKRITADHRLKKFAQHFWQKPFNWGPRTPRYSTEVKIMPTVKRWEGSHLCPKCRGVLWREWNMAVQYYQTQTVIDNLKREVSNARKRDH